MNGLRFSRLATATLLARKRAYAGLALGITLAVALVFTLLVAATSQFGMLEGQWREQTGGQDAIVFDAAGLEDSKIEDIAAQVGHITVVAQVSGVDASIGFYDGVAAQLLNRRVLSGRMPQAPGEIALDRGVLAQLRLPADLGQLVTLPLFPMQEGSPAEAKTTFALVGVLADQSQADQSGWGFYDHVHTRPGGVTVPQPPLSGSRAVVHKVLQFNPGAGEKALNERLQEQGYDGHASVFAWEPFDNPQQYDYVLSFALLCLSLLLCAGIAILNVFQNRLKQREQQIGMLRAVGATRRQITLLYGQEAVLIALVTAPLGLLVGIGAAKLLLLATTKAPLMVLPGIVPVGLAVSLAVIMLSAALPLRRASRLAPIRVIRDADLMLAGKRLKMKSQRRYEPARLLAKRSMRLNRRGVTGVSVLVCLCMAVLSFLALLPLQFSGDPGLLIDERPAFSLSSNRGWATSGGVSIVSRAAGLSRGDIAELSGLPQVSRVDDKGTTQALVVVSNPTSYLTDAPESSLYTARHGANWMAMVPAEQKQQLMDTLRQQQLDMQQALDTQGELLTTHVYVLNRARLARLAPYITQGTLDLDAIDRGESWLVCAPDIYVVIDEDEHLLLKPVLSEGDVWEAHLQNDYFHVGDMVDVRQLYLFEDEFDGGPAHSDNLKNAHQRQAQRPISAVLDGPLAPQANAILSAYGPHATLVTTPGGMAAMNLYGSGPDDVDIYLSGTADLQTEAWLFSRVEEIVLRAPGLQAHNLLSGARKGAMQRVQVLALFGGLLLVFFTMCLGLMNNSLSGRLRADRRAIGSLRALGADSGMLGRMYARQLWMMLLGGVVPGTLLAAVITLWQSSQWYLAYPWWVYALVMGLEMLLAALMLGFSYLHLKNRLHGMLKQPIIAQIREIG